tara:strand:+ start:496 stop:912 length:417 start_codon:yes stop_codon:yes gene_type:complete
MNLVWSEGVVGWKPEYVNVATGEVMPVDRPEMEKKFPAMEHLEEMEDALFVDGMEKALIAVGHRFGHAVAIYDRRLCLEVLMERDGMTYEEAIEFFDFNIAGAYVGDHTPIFVSTWAEREDENDGQEDKSDTGSSDHN